MPSSIPYNPSLVLGHNADTEKLKENEQIAELQAPVESAENTPDSSITLKQSLDITKQEMIEMAVGTEELIDEISQVKSDI